MIDNFSNRRKPPPRHIDPNKKRETTVENDDGENMGIIEGRNAVIEALRAGRSIDKVYLAKGETDTALGHIAAKARQSGAVVVEADKRKLDAMSVTHTIKALLRLPLSKPTSVSMIYCKLARDKNEAPLIVVCDEYI